MLLHFILSIILFFLVNSIGKRSYGLGYISFSLFDTDSESHSVNIAIKVLTPIIYLIIVSSILEYFKLSNYKLNINYLIYYYIIIRICLIFIFERQRIVNWARIVSYYALLVTFSLLIYKLFISKIDYLLPDFAQIKNEIWLLIFIFIYNLYNKNKLDINEDSGYPNLKLEIKNRKKLYILRQFDRFNSKFNAHLLGYCKNDKNLNLVVYSMLIYENFNRPYLIRQLENVFQKLFKKEMTVGLMQIKSKKKLSDEESIKIGVERLLQSKYKVIFNNPRYSFYEYLDYSTIIKSHCPDTLYVHQILFIAKIILNNRFQYNDIKENYYDLYETIKEELSLSDDLINMESETTIISDEEVTKKIEYLLLNENNTRTKIKYLTNLIEINPKAKQYYYKRSEIHKEEGNIHLSEKDRNIAETIEIKESKAYPFLKDFADLIEKKDYIKLLNNINLALENDAPNTIDLIGFKLALLIKLEKQEEFKELSKELGLLEADAIEEFLIPYDYIIEFNSSGNENKTKASNIKDIIERYT